MATNNAINSRELVKTNNLSDVSNAGTARTNLGVGTGDSPQFTAIELGHASDTTLARSGAGVVTIEGVEVTTNSGTQTLSNKTLTAPKFADLGFIADANGNELIILDTVTSAVNEITLANAATGANPNITASGGDTNVGIDLTPKGTGFVQIRGNSTQAGTLAFYEDTDDGTNYSAFQGSARAGNIIYTLPTTDPTASQVLQAGAPSGGVSALTWANNVATLSIGSTVTSGTATSLLWVDTGPVLAQDASNLVWDKTNKKMRVGPTDSTITAENKFAAITTSNTYGGFYGRNQSSGNRAVCDMVLSNNLTGATDYFEIAVNGSANTDPAYPILTGNDVLFHANGGLDSMVFALNDSAERYIWCIGGVATTSERMRLTTSGLTVGLAGTALGTILFSGSTSGTTTVQPAATASGTLTLPAATDTLVGKATTDTLTNKRITKRTGTVASSATPTINTDNVDFYSITALAVDITSMTTNLSGTPTEGQTLWIAITGTAARAITWGASFESSGNVILPTTTVSTTRLDVGLVWNTVTSKWRCVAVA